MSIGMYLKVMGNNKVVLEFRLENKLANIWRDIATNSLPGSGKHCYVAVVVLNSLPI